MFFIVSPTVRSPSELFCRLIQLLTAPVHRLDSVRLDARHFTGSDDPAGGNRLNFFYGVVKSAMQLSPGLRLTADGSRWTTIRYTRW